MAAFRVGERVCVGAGSGLDSIRCGYVMDWSDRALRFDHHGIPRGVEGAYSAPNRRIETPVRMDGGYVILMFNNRLTRERSVGPTGNLAGLAAVSASRLGAAPGGLAERFFYAHAGSSYTPGKETQEQGKVRGAKALARAEVYAARHGWRVDWRHDADCDREDYEHGEDVQIAILRDGSGAAIDSLGCIVGADRDYRRVIEAELALTAMGERRRGRR